MDLATLFLVWCRLLFLIVTIYASDQGVGYLCESSVISGDIRICYWGIHSYQDITASEAQCNRNNGTLAYIPSPESLSVAVTLMKTQLGEHTLVYVGYMLNQNGSITIRGTDQVQSWVSWDAGQPENNVECIVIYTYTGKFHDIGCTVMLFALCSRQYKLDITTEATTDVATDVTNDVINNTTCDCDCPARPNLIIYSAVNISKELQDKLDTLKKETEVNEETLSSRIRKRTSASDPRPSSAYVGYLGIVLLTVIFGGIVAMDLPRVVNVLKTSF